MYNVPCLLHCPCPDLDCHHTRQSQVIVEIGNVEQAKNHFGQYDMAKLIEKSLSNINKKVERGQCLFTNLLTIKNFFVFIAYNQSRITEEDFKLSKESIQKLKKKTHSITWKNLSLLEEIFTLRSTCTSTVRMCLGNVLF